MYLSLSVVNQAEAKLLVPGFPPHWAIRVIAFFFWSAHLLKQIPAWFFLHPWVHQLVLCLSARAVSNIPPPHLKTFMVCGGVCSGGFSFPWQSSSWEGMWYIVGMWSMVGIWNISGLFLPQLVADRSPECHLCCWQPGMGSGHWNVDLAVFNGFKGIVCCRMFALLWFALCWRGQFNFLLM